MRRIAPWLQKAVQAQPGAREILLQIQQWLELQILKLPPCRPVAQTHGDLNQRHVLISPASVAVIDWDMSCPSYPSKDATQFIHSLRTTAFKLGVSQRRADSATAAFLEEYLSLIPEAKGEIGYSLPFLAFLGLLRSLVKLRRGALKREVVDFCLQEMKQAMEMRL
jgi:aminoglycoside phosphotransferase (APT) family kinase protein